MCINDDLEWRKVYSVGSEVIDNQHKELVEMTNSLFQGCTNSTQKEMHVYMRTIKKAVKYTKIHFETEEKIMQKVNYPEYILHKTEHEQFVEEVVKQLKKIEGGICIPLEFAIFLKNWVLNHIAVSDKKYSPFLKGIKEEDFAS